MFWSKTNDHKIKIERFGGVSLFRKEQNRYLREYCSKLGALSILNLGAKPNDPDKEGNTYEAYFPDSAFRTLDLGPCDDPRHFCDDLMSPSLNIGTYDLVLAMSVIEHIDRPWLAATEITKLIRPGGYLYVAMPFFYPVHEGPYYGDHWRCTPSGMGFLFDQLKQVRCNYYPTSIKVIKDRNLYWNNPHSCAAGFSMLMQRP